MSTDDGGTFLWDLKTDTPVPLTFTNWNKHQPGSQALRVCSSTVNTAAVLSCPCFNYFFPYPPPQSALAAVLLCQVGLLWVGGRSRTAGTSRLCHCASEAFTMTTISSCQSASLIPTPPVLQGGNHTLNCCCVLR